MTTNARIWSFDIVRGILLLLILLTHTIFFFHSDTSQILVLLRSIGDVIGFTGLVFISGAAAYSAYIHYSHPTISVRNRILRRLAMYLVGYYIVAIAGSIAQDTLTRSAVWDILTFRAFIPFTEFLVPLMVFGVLKIPLRSFLDWTSRSVLRVAVASVILQSVATWVYTRFGGQHDMLNMLVGAPGSFIFPIAQYFTVYLVGVYVGRQYWIHTTSHTRFMRLALIAVTLVLTSGLLVFARIVSNPASMPWLSERWPPSALFLMIGMIVTIFMLLVIKVTGYVRRAPEVRRVLLLFGQNTYALYVMHILILFLYDAFIGVRVPSVLHVSAFFVVTTFLAVYLARITPLNYSFSLTLVRWCECRLGHCTHSGEHELEKRLKRLLHGIISLPELFTVRIGSGKTPVISSWIPFIGMSVYMLVAIPLGILETHATYEHAVTDQKGHVSRIWSLTHDQTPLMYTVELPDTLDDQAVVRFAIDGVVMERMVEGGGIWSADIETSAIPPGEHSLTSQITLGGSMFETRPTVFRVSEPLYITWTIDWEGYDTRNDYLDSLARIAREHEIPMTHLFNPRIYTTSDIPPERVAYMTEWVKARRDIYGEEIGLHLHMFPDFVEAAGVTPVLEPAWGGGFSYGYDMLTSNYDADDMQRILAYAKSLFVDYDLGIPTSFRAGAWFASSETLQALAASGFHADTSARTSYTFGTNSIPGPWDVESTQPPYYPSASDQNSTGFDALPILEIPNNGADSFAFSARDMIARFDMNYDGEILETPRQVTYLSHPHWFNASRQEAMDTVFSYITQYSYAHDQGPVVFATTETVYQAFKNAP